MIAGAAVKGPAAKVMAAAGFRADAAGIAAYYAGLVDTVMIDTTDSALAPLIAGMDVHLADILMQTAADKARLAREICHVALTEAPL